MNYIFDVCLNFNKELYDFYEWNNNDNLEYFLKIPIVKVDEETIKNFIIHDIKVSNNFLKKIYNKSQKYENNIVKNNKYSCILSSNSLCIAINFDENGYDIGKSYLSLEEETEVIEFSKFLKFSIVEYKIIKKNSIKNNYFTRKESNNIKILNRFVNSLVFNKKYDELEYIYYELYSDKSNNYKYIKNKIISAINNSDVKRNILVELYNLVGN